MRPNRVSDAVGWVTLALTQQIQSVSKALDRLKLCRSNAKVSEYFPLAGSVLYYENPFEPATDIKDWDIVR